MERSKFYMFLNTAAAETAKETPEWSLIGDGVTELSVSYNPQTNTEQYIHEDVARTTVTGYQPNAAVTAQAKKGDKVYDYINNMRKTLPIGDSAISEVVLVDRYEEKKPNGYPAQRQEVTIQIDSYGGAASDPLSIGYTINWNGVAKQGYFKTEAKLEFKEDAGEAA